MQQTVGREDIEQRVLETLESFGVDPDGLLYEAGFEELDLDSLDVLELAQIVEDEYGVEISAEDAEDLRTVQQFVDVILARMRAA